MNHQGLRESNLTQILKFRKPRASEVYLYSVSLLGLVAVIWGLVLIPTYTPLFNFFLLALLAAASQFATTSVPISKKAGITFEVGTAVALAAIPFYGSAAAAAIVAFSSLSIWLAKAHDEITWKKSWRQLAFNTGMWSIAIYVAGSVFVFLESIVGNSLFVSQVILWFSVAVINTLVNFWLLVGMLRLQHGPQVKPFALWQENRWAATIDILVKSIGGGFLAFTNGQYDTVGILVFFLPILLSAYAFRLYVQQMQGHMDNLEEIITQRTEALSSLMQEKDAFLAVLSHDMKTPLTTIGMYAEMLVQYPNLIQNKPEIANILKTNQQALTQMVHNILDLEKLQVAGSLQIEPEPFDLVQTLESVTDLVKIQAERKSIEIVQAFSLSCLPILADPHQITRVFQNLLSNAIKYSAKNSCVTLSVQHDIESVCITVKDTGYGIPEEELPFIFDRFRRVEKHTRIAAGTGIGLAIVKAIVEAHSGEVLVHSVEGEGSEFSVMLPLEVERIPV